MLDQIVRQRKISTSGNKQDQTGLRFSTFETNHRIFYCITEQMKQVKN